MYFRGSTLCWEGREARQGKARRGEGWRGGTTWMPRGSTRSAFVTACQPDAAVDFTRTIRLAIKLYTRRARVQR
jgi:hypothetical protein